MPVVVVLNCAVHVTVESRHQHGVEAVLGSGKALTLVAAVASAGAPPQLSLEAIKRDWLS